MKTGTLVADTALVEEIAITPANINDGKAGPDALPDDPGEVFADSAYRAIISATRCAPRVERHASSPAGCGDGTKLKHWRALRPGTNRSTRLLGRIENIFGTWKRSYGLRRMRWRGLAKAGVQIRLTAIAYNMKRSL
ncbi:transposase [Rhizobium mongolense]|uniref:transposase n=1 Tax=Rhizobium mongolense TaxID=57676 RepID=UPI0034A1B4C6